MPRIAFVNKLDREGANPEAVTEQLRSKLKLNAAMIQVPIGLSAEHVGVCDLVELRATTFEGPNGDQPTPGPIPAELEAQVQAKRAEMLERLADCDEEIAEYYINEEEPPLEVLRAAIRRQTIANTFTPVMMGSAFKNKGVQTLLDGVVHYLPNPREVSNVGLDLKNDEAQVDLSGKAEDPFVGLAFKLEEGRFGQLTYMRIYQGSLARGQSIISMVDKKKVRVPKLVRMNSNDMEDVEVGQAGDIVAMFGVDCASGTTFTDGQRHISMTSMFVPDPVISLSRRRIAITPILPRPLVASPKRTPRSGCILTMSPTSASSPGWVSCTSRSMWSGSSASITASAPLASRRLPSVRRPPPRASLCTRTRSRVAARGSLVVSRASLSRLTKSSAAAPSSLRTA